MSQIINISDAAANAEANAVAPLCNSGTINIYSGTQPINANTGLSGNTLLVTLTFSSTAFGSAAAGVITANAITSGTAVATGTATFGRFFKSDATTVVADWPIGTSGNAININTTSIVSGGLVSCGPLTWTLTET